MSDRTLLILNSAASRLRDPVRRARVVAAVRAAPHLAGSSLDVVTVGDQTALAALARSAVADGVGRMIVAGGDATVVAVAGALAGTPVPLAILPGGAGNILAGSLGIRGSPERAPDLLRNARVRRLDLASAGFEEATAEGESVAGSRLFGVAAGIGFDARVMAATTPSRKHRLGHLSYFAAAGWAALGVRNMECRITVDGRTVETEAAIVLVANAGELVPGLVRPRHPIRPDDGLLDIFAVRGNNPIDGFRGVLAALTGPVTRGDPRGSAWRTRARDVRIETDRPEPAEVDGDVVGTSPLTARMLAETASVLVPLR